MIFISKNSNPNKSPFGFSADDFDFNNPLLNSLKSF